MSFMQGAQNALAVMAPDAFQQGMDMRDRLDQRRDRRQLGNALAQGGSYEDAANMAFGSGNIDAGLQFRQMYQGQQSAASTQTQAAQEQRRAEAERTANYFSHIRPMMDQPGFDLDTFIARDPQGFEASTGMSLQEWGQLTGGQQRMTPQLVDQIIMKARAETGMAPAQPASPEIREVGGALVSIQNGQATPIYQAPQQMPDTYRTLEARAQAAGLQPGTPQYQQFMQQGGRTDAPMVQVNTGDAPGPDRPMVGTPPTGFQRVWDDQAGTWRDVAIPGSAQDSDASQESIRASAAHQAAEAQFDTTMTNIDAALEQANMFTTGLASPLSEIPGTPARDLRARVDTVRALIGFDTLQRMRENSPTGGALGNVTERELAFLQSVQGSLDQAQTPQQFVEILGEVRASLERVREIQRIHYQLGQSSGSGQAQPRVVTPQPAAPAGTTVVDDDDIHALIEQYATAAD